MESPKSLKKNLKFIIGSRSSQTASLLALDVNFELRRVTFIDVDDIIDAFPGKVRRFRSNMNNL